MVDVARMRADLLTARKARDKVVEVALKRALAAIENAEAPPITTTGPTEVPRLVLGADDVVHVLERELAEAAIAAQQYEDGGHPEAAARLRAESAVIAMHLPERS